MGNAAIYYYPEADAPLEVIDLGEPLSDMQVSPVRIVDTATGMDLEPSTVDLGGSHRVRITLERFTSQTIVAQLRTFEAHALRGLPFGLVADTADSWAGFASSGSMRRGRQTLTTSGSAFTSWSTALTLSSSDTVVIHSMNPEYKHEQRAVSSYNSSTGAIDLGVGNETVYEYEVGPVVVRHRDFFPFCYLDPSDRGPILTHYHRIHWTLDLSALYSPSGMRSLYQDGSTGTLVGATASGGYLEGTLQGMASTTSSNWFGSTYFSGPRPSL